METFECRIPPRPEKVALVRHAFRDWLEAGRIAPEAVFDAVVIASELITNGVLHDGGDDLTLRAQREGPILRLEVTSYAGPPEHRYSRDPLEPAEGGRGLLLVAHLAEHSVVTQGPRRVDRCELPV